VNRNLTLEDVLERNHEHLVLLPLALAARQLPPLALHKLGHDALHEADLVRLALMLVGQGHLATDQSLEPLLIRLKLVSNLIALLCQFQNSLDSLHCTRYTPRLFICDCSRMSLADVTIMSLSEIVGDFGFKNVARLGFGNVQGWVAGISGYIGVIYYLIRSLRVGNVTYVNGMWDGISAVLETAAAFFIFGERMNSWTQYLGLGLIITGMYVLRSGGIPH